MYDRATLRLKGYAVPDATQRSRLHRRTSEYLDSYAQEIGWAHYLMTGEKMWSYVTTAYDHEGDYGAAIAF